MKQTFIIFLLALSLTSCTERGPDINTLANADLIIGEWGLTIIEVYESGSDSIIDSADNSDLGYMYHFERGGKLLHYGNHLYEYAYKVHGPEIKISSDGINWGIPGKIESIGEKTMRIRWPSDLGYDSVFNYERL